MRFTYNVHVPGKELYTADTLSRAPMDASTLQDQNLYEQTKMYINAVIYQVPASDNRLQEILHYQQNDPACLKVIKYD